MVKRTYYFEEDLLTKEEKHLITERDRINKEIDKIYKRTDALIRERKKLEKAKERKEYEKSERNRKKEELENKKRRDELIKSENIRKYKDFSVNYAIFKKDFYTLFNELKEARSNFQDTKLKEYEIIICHAKFTKDCIHPVFFKSKNKFSYESCDGGGSGFGTSTYRSEYCDSCELCHSWRKWKDMEYSSEKINDAQFLDDIKKIPWTVNVMENLGSDCQGPK